MRSGWKRLGLMFGRSCLNQLKKFFCLSDIEVFRDGGEGANLPQ